MQDKWKRFCNDKDRLRESSNEFAHESNCLIWGAVGALDGWLAEIWKPSQLKDRVKNLSSFFSRKGFFAANVQVLVDRKKKVLCRSILCRGAEHDSSAFKECSLCKLLQTKWKQLEKKSHHVLGDSVCSL